MRRDRWFRLLLGVALLAGAYCLSYGIAARLEDRRGPLPPIVWAAYKPIIHLQHHGPRPLRGPLWWYEQRCTGSPFGVTLDDRVYDAWKDVATAMFGTRPTDVPRQPPSQPGGERR